MQIETKKALAHEAGQGLTGSLYNTPILCYGCGPFGWETDCSVCNTIRALLLMLLQLNGLAILALIEVIKRAWAATVEVQPMATERRGRMPRWLTVLRRRDCAAGFRRRVGAAYGHRRAVDLLRRDRGAGARRGGSWRRRRLWDGQGWRRHLQGKTGPRLRVPGSSVAPMPQRALFGAPQCQSVFA
ncbi:MAG: hypothetical protein OXH63_09020 [Gemmatimonadetes bacterium]|nr:hypothetical protein [Gemmatimonadota bacterium]